MANISAQQPTWEPGLTTCAVKEGDCKGYYYTNVHLGFDGNDYVVRDRAGKVVIKGVNQTIPFGNYLVVEGVDEKWGLYDKDGNNLMPRPMDLICVNPQDTGKLIAIEEDGSQKLVNLNLDENGHIQKLTQSKNNYIFISEPDTNGFRDGVDEENMLRAIIGPDGTQLTGFEFKNIYEFTKLSNQGEFAAKGINKDGDEVVISISDNVATVNKITPPVQRIELTEVEIDASVVQETGVVKPAVVEDEDTEEIEAGFDVGFAYNGLALTTNERGKHAFMNAEGQILSKHMGFTHAVALTVDSAPDENGEINSETIGYLLVRTTLSGKNKYSILSADFKQEQYLRNVGEGGPLLWPKGETIGWTCDDMHIDEFHSLPLENPHISCGNYTYNIQTKEMICHKEPIDMITPSGIIGFRNGKYGIANCTILEKTPTVESKIVKYGKSTYLVYGDDSIAKFCKPTDDGKGEYISFGTTKDVNGQKIDSTDVFYIKPIPNTGVTVFETRGPKGGLDRLHGAVTPTGEFLPLSKKPLKVAGEISNKFLTQEMGNDITLYDDEGKIVATNAKHVSFDYNEKTVILGYKNESNKTLYFSVPANSLGDKCISSASDLIQSGIAPLESFSPKAKSDNKPSANNEANENITNNENSALRM